MGRKSNIDNSLFVRSGAPARGSAPSTFSTPSPEEGHRLLRDFMSIRQPALREAVIELVMRLSISDGRR